MIKPAIKGVLNVLKACAREKEVKRVILTSSAAAVTINELEGTGHVMDETNWSDVEFLNTAKPPTWVKIKLYLKYLDYFDIKWDNNFPQQFKWLCSLKLNTWLWLRFQIRYHGLLTMILNVILHVFHVYLNTVWMIYEYHVYSNT